MKFVELCKYFERIDATTKRLEKTAVLVELLKKIEGGEVRAVINIALGQLASAYERVQFNLAEKMLLRAIAISSKLPLEQVTAQFDQVGDVGVLTEKLLGDRAVVKQESLSISEVYERLLQIARESGVGSQERKVGGVVQLLAQCAGVDAKYIVRMINESLRLGFSDSTMVDVFSFFVSGNKDHSLELEKIYQMRPDLALLGEEVVTLGIERTIAGSGVRLGIPVMPALAQRLGSVDEMIEKMGAVYVEPKIDGTRLQIHFSKNGVERYHNQAPRINQELNLSNQTALFEEEKSNVWVKTFTRNLDENTAQFPELMEIGEELAAHEVILDAEAVGYDPETGALLPFQMTITRKRKHGVGEAKKNVPLKFFVFDILYLDGKTLIETPLSERRRILKSVIGGDKILVVNEAIETDQPTRVRQYHSEQLAKGYEGVLVKKKEGIYEPGRAGFNWVKLKEVENTSGKLSDTLDCVVIGYYYGRGKRSGFGLGAFLVGIAGEEGMILTIAKIGTGLTDEQFRDMYERLKNLEIKSSKAEYEVSKLLIPDVWVKPELVVEIAADEITVSPSHSAGYALRFPRLVRFREDKSRAEITTLSEIKGMYGQQ